MITPSTSYHCKLATVFFPSFICSILLYYFYETWTIKKYEKDRLEAFWRGKTRTSRTERKRNNTVLQEIGEQKTTEYMKIVSSIPCKNYHYYNYEKESEIHRPLEEDPDDHISMTSSIDQWVSFYTNIRRIWRGKEKFVYKQQGLAFRNQ